MITQLPLPGTNTAEISAHRYEGNLPALEDRKLGRVSVTQHRMKCRGCDKRTRHDILKGNCACWSVTTCSACGYVNHEGTHD